MNKKLKSKKLYLIYISIFILLIDIITKKLVINKLCLGCILYFFSFVNITHVHNLGGAFNFLSDRLIWQIFILNFSSIFIIFLFLIKIIIYNNLNKIDNISNSMILGGSLGNLFDRLNNKYIIDFLDLHINNFHFPIFNIADISIVIGLFLILYKIILDYLIKFKINKI
ncbi:MAG: signal peptidase II [Enterobacterales bacterium]